MANAPDVSSADRLEMHSYAAVIVPSAMVANRLRYTEDDGAHRLRLSPVRTHDHRHAGDEITAGKESVLAGKRKLCSGAV
jgi:hypothetical protein